jgi:hypothetical protein
VDLDMPKPDVLVTDGVAKEPPWVRKQRTIDNMSDETKAQIRENLAKLSNTYNATTLPKSAWIGQHPHDKKSEGKEDETPGRATE